MVAPRKLTGIKKYKTKIGSLSTAIKEMQRVQPVVQPRRPALRTQGPAHLGRGADPELVKGPREPPAGWTGAFPGGASADEWKYLYWPLAKVLRNPKDPRRPPFVGGWNWRYQTSVDGGRLIKGGQVVDAEVDWGGHLIGIRLMTERWHAAARREQQIRDLQGKVKLAKYYRVCDIWTQAVAEDETGEAACQAVADCLRAKETPDPFTYGFKRVRPKQSKAERNEE